MGGRFVSFLFLIHVFCIDLYEVFSICVCVQVESADGGDRLLEHRVEVSGCVGSTVHLSCDGAIF